MRGFFWPAIFLGLDQLVKLIVLKTAPNLITPNPGFALNFTLGFPGLMIVIGLIILAYLLHSSHFGRFIHQNSGSFYLMLAGGISNLIDRIFRGYVVDYIHISQMPVFNIADIGIVLGGLILIFNMIKFNPLRSR